MTRKSFDSVPISLAPHNRAPPSSDDVMLYRLRLALAWRSKFLNAASWREETFLFCLLVARWRYFYDVVSLFVYTFHVSIKATPHISAHLSLILACQIIFQSNADEAIFAALGGVRRVLIKKRFNVDLWQEKTLGKLIKIIKKIVNINFVQGLGNSRIVIIIKTWTTCTATLCTPSYFTDNDKRSIWFRHRVHYHEIIAVKTSKFPHCLKTTFLSNRGGRTGSDNDKE